MTSNLFKNWADRIHKENLISEIEEINRDEVLTQLSQDDLNTEVIHDLKKFKEEYKEKMTYVRGMPKGGVDTEADPQVEIPKEISPKSSTASI